MEQHAQIRVARVYDEPGRDDGQRILVDRLWPRGLSKGAAHVDLWLKEVAPSGELRRWYGHQQDRFDEFARRYQDELDDPDRLDALVRLRRLVSMETVTLLTASKAVEISNAAVLAALLRGQDLSP